MILISILVHEKYEVILDQIENIRKFVPEALVVIHPSRQFLESTNPAQIKNLSGVLVNPSPFYTGTGMVLKCHVSNFLFACSAGCDFTHFCLHSSNDLFVRHGVEAYVRKHNYGFFALELSKELNFQHWMENFDSDTSYAALMKAAGSKPTRYVSQVEGTFYPREAFADFASLFKRHAWNELGWPINYCHGTNKRLVEIFERLQRRPRWRKYIGRYFYTKEEFYPPNYFLTRTSQPASPYCYMNWKNKLVVTSNDLECILAGNLPDSRYDDLFSVKRIDRDLNDPMRVMIRGLV